MEDLYPVLKMAYRDVKVISRKAGIYLCSDNLGEKPVLYINNEVSSKGIDFVSMSLGKSWAAMLYMGGNVEIIDKQDGKVLQSFDEIKYLSKQNIYKDRYSVLTLRPKNTEFEKIAIIDNRKARIIVIYDNIANRVVNNRGKYELVLYTKDNGAVTTIGLDRNMKGVILNHETKCTA